jgi:GntR family transcriptional regulator
MTSSAEPTWAAPTPTSTTSATPAHFRGDLRARMPDPKVRGARPPDLEHAVVDVVRTAFTNDGLPGEINEMTLDASAYVCRYHFSA